MAAAIFSKQTESQAVSLTFLVGSFLTFLLGLQMKSLLALLCVAVAFAVTSADDDTTTARLLASKNILNQLLVEGKDLTVEYVIYNVGGRYAS